MIIQLVNSVSSYFRGGNGGTETSEDFHIVTELETIVEGLNPAILLQSLPC